MFSEGYLKISRLMVRVLALTAQEKIFALKGGTAINLFVRDMPRLSVDIDLVYLPMHPREQALIEIDAALQRIADKAARAMPGAITEFKFLDEENTRIKLVIRLDGLQIKVEPNYVLRGVLFDIQNLTISKRAAELLDMEIEVPVVSFWDLYAGKLCAALDRQHPRDLFDMKILMEQEGIQAQLLDAFVVYLASGTRPMHEILKGSWIDLAPVFASQFSGMTEGAISLGDLEETREKMQREVLANLSDSQKEFLIALKEQGQIRGQLLGLPQVNEMPALLWKKQNIEKMDKQKRAQQLGELKRILKV